MSKKNKYKRKTTAKSDIKTHKSTDKSGFDENAYTSFTSGSRRVEMPKMITDKQARRRKIICTLLKIALIICTCYWAVFNNIFAGIGMIIKPASQIHQYGVPMLIATFAVILATALVLRNKNIPAVVIGVAGLIAVLLLVGNMCEVVDSLALSDDEFQMMSDIYKNRHNPTIIVTILQTILAIIQYFGYEESVKRAKRRQIRLDKKYAEAPKILGDDE